MKVNPIKDFERVAIKTLGGLVTGGSATAAFEKAKRDGLIRQTDVGHESGVWVTA